MSLEAGMKGVIEKIDSDGDFRVKTYTRCRKDKDPGQVGFIRSGMPSLRWTRMNQNTTRMNACGAIGKSRGRAEETGLRVLLWLGYTGRGSRRDVCSHSICAHVVWCT